jgi:hypothetical protein
MGTRLYGLIRHRMRMESGGCELFDASGHANGGPALWLQRSDRCVSNRIRGWLETAYVGTIKCKWAEGGAFYASTSSL